MGLRPQGPMEQEFCSHGLPPASHRPQQLCEVFLPLFFSVFFASHCVASSMLLG